MSTPLAVSCPNCGAGLKLKNNSFVGKKVPCPKCKKPFLVEEPPEDEFLAEDDFGGDDFQEEEEEEPRPKKSSKGGGKGKKKSKSSGGSGAALMIGGIVLGIAVLGGVVYGAIQLVGKMGGGSSQWTAWMPPDSEVIVRVRPADLSNTPFLKPVMEHPTLSKLANSPPDSNGLNQVATALNLTFRDVDTVTLGGKSFDPGVNGAANMMVAIKTKVAFDPAKLDQAATVLTKETYNGKSVYAINAATPKALLYAPSTDLLVFGSDSNVRAAIDRNGAGPGSRFQLNDANAQVYFCTAPENPASGGAAPSSPFNSSFGFGGTNKTDMVSMSIGLNVSSDAAITVVMNAKDRLNSELQTSQFKTELEGLKSQLAASGGLIDPTAGLKNHVKTMLDGATISVSGKTATIKMTLPGQIVPDGLALAGPFMPMLEAQIAEQQKASPPPAVNMTPAAGTQNSSGSPSITDYPGAVINAGNSAQNRANNLANQHNADVAAQMQSGGSSSHGDSSGGAPAGNPAAAMQQQVQAGGGASSSHGDSSGGNSGGAPAPAPAVGPPGGAAARSHGGDSSGGAAPPAAGGPPMGFDQNRAAMEQQMRQQQNGGGGAGFPGGDQNRAAMEQQMRQQQNGGGGAGFPGGDQNRAAMEQQMRQQQNGGGGAGFPGGDQNRAAMEQQMRQQQNGGGGAGFPGGDQNRAAMEQQMRQQNGGQNGQPNGAQQNGNGTQEGSKPKSRSRRRTN